MASLQHAPSHRGSLPAARRARRSVRWVLAAALGGIAVFGANRVVGLDADLSHHLIAITTAFTGTDVLLFGVVDEPGSDVAVVVQGPLGDQIVRRKTRVGVIWLNTDQMRFRNVPAFYAAAASRPLDEIARPAVLQRHGIGIGNLRIRAATSQQGDPAREAEFLAALVRNKQRQGLYAREVGEVSFLGRSLFRTRLAFPANVPPGSYQVQVFQLRDRGVTSAQSSPLGISKIGLEADLFDLAHRLSALYGLGSILLAGLAGWAGYAMFRKR